MFPPSRARDAASIELDVEAALGRIRHVLPRQGPIKDFVHHNTLHAFERLPFHLGVAAGARLYGARAAMPQDFYLTAYRDGRIPASALDRALESAFDDEAERASARRRMLAGALDEPQPSSLARNGLRAAWTGRLGGVPLHRRSQLDVLRLVGGFFDQGLSLWRMPGADRLGLWACVRALVEESALPVPPLDTPVTRGLVALPAPRAVQSALARMVRDPEEHERYLLETLLALPGWSGLVAECERDPGLLLSPRRASLVDLAAVVLVTEVGCLERGLGADFEPLDLPTPSEGTFPTYEGPRPQSESEALFAVWQEAFEWSYGAPFLGGLAANAAARRAPRPAADVWAVFCIDERSCSIRRHVEELSPRIDTFGTPGFFGLDFMYRGAGDAIASKHCPAPVRPRHLIVEELDDPDEGGPRREPKWTDGLPFEDRSTFFRGFFLSYALGLGAAARLALSVLKPSLAPVEVAPLSTVDRTAHFRLLRDGDARSADGLLLGYSPEELAERLASVIETCGTGGDFPDLVALFGHGASSANNPYFAAYNCGACSGRSGAPNARAFAKAGNRPEVRAALRALGVDLPERTRFVAAVLDTTRDEATWFDLDRVPEELHASLGDLRRTVDEALARNAAERCRRFETVPLAITPAAALATVRERAVALFEPRPEYNHATNASCVIGRRSLTAGLFLDRRTFLASYDPTGDPNGVRLVRVLSSVVPVCAGINLEYFFSRLDPRVYGAGTKLPHNVNGLLGVCNGIDNDLLTGLPTQMTEIHDPLRLLVVVEHAPGVALRAAEDAEGVSHLVANEWIRYACFDPSTRRTWLHAHGEMIEVHDLPAPSHRWPGSLDAVRASRANLPVGFVGAGAAPGVGA